MHPAFVSRGGATPVPIWFVAADTYAQVRAQLGAAARRFAESAKFEPKPGQSLLLPGADGALSGVLFGLEPADKPDKDRFLPGRLPGLLPAGIYRFANAPHDTRLAALAFALGATSSRATARRRRTARSSNCPTASTARSCRASPRACPSRAISSTRRRTIWVRPSWTRPRATLAAQPRREHPRDRRRRTAEAELPADPRGRPRLAARAAPDRSHLGRSRAHRRSRWSARACASTPAGSTSSPTPAC